MQENWIIKYRRGRKKDIFQMEESVNTESLEANPEDVSPQYLQKKLYFLIENLKSYHEKLPM